MGYFNFIILPPEENPPARWIGLKEASKYARIGKNRLINLAQAGIVTGGQDSDNKRGDWIFDRESIDRYRIEQAGKMQALIFYKFCKSNQR